MADTCAESFLLLFGGHNAQNSTKDQDVGEKNEQQISTIQVELKKHSPKATDPGVGVCEFDHVWMETKRVGKLWASLEGHTVHNYN